ATATCFGLLKGEGEHHLPIPHPAGTIDTTCIVRNGVAEEVYIEGPVGLTDIIVKEVEIED
ncbi:MAG: hypothetical protein IKG71_06405, partial [Firmicutes bacterium]|nr:hypothetical protein [Bacillota bacterium]